LQLFHIAKIDNLRIVWAKQRMGKQLLGVVFYFRK